MDQSRVTEAQSNVHGSYSGNQGNSNVFGSSISNAAGNIYQLPNVTNLRVGTPSGIYGVGEEAPRPYRLIPYGRNSSFTGRKNVIESVKRVSEGPGHNRVALQGLGGSGKTQIALEYVYQCISDRDCDVFWVQGSGILKFREGFRAVGQHARIPLAGAENDEEDFLLGIRRWFEGRNCRDWILVIDNADNEVDFDSNNSPIARFIPQGSSGTVILTTRSRQVASRQGCKTITVGKMGEEEARELFSKRFGSWDSLEEEEKKAVGMILDSVDHLPLAVIGSAAFLVETATPPSVYWNIFQENEEKMKQLLSVGFCDIQRESDMTESILGTFFVTFDRIRQQMPAAADLLRLMAFLDRQNIPEELLSQSGLEGVDGAVEFRRAIGKLLGFSLVMSGKRENKTFYELHRLVQLSLQAYLPTADLNQARSAALQVVSRLFPRDENERRHIGLAYIPHAIAVTEYSTDPTTEELCFHMGQYFLDMGFYNNAEIRFRQCLELREEGKEYDWDDQGHLRLVQLGRVSAYQGKFDEAEVITRHVLEWCEKILGVDHPDTLTSLDTLATALAKQGKYKESETVSRRGLEGREKILGPHDHDTLKSVDNLAIALWGQSKYDDLEAMNRHALERREKVLGLYHPDTLKSVNNLAITLWSQGKYCESEAMLWRALEGYVRVLGPHHPHTLTSVDGLAITLWSQGRRGESEAMGRRALDGREKVLGLHHPATLHSATNLAAKLRSQGKCSESDAMLRRALEGHEKVLGSHRPDTLGSVNNLAAMLWSQAKYSESEAMRRRGLEGPERPYEPNSLHTQTSAHDLAIAGQGQAESGESEMLNGRFREGLQRNPRHKGLRFTYRRVLGFLKAASRGTDERPQ